MAWMSLKKTCEVAELELALIEIKHVYKKNGLNIVETVYKGKQPFYAKRIAETYLLYWVQDKGEHHKFYLDGKEVSLLELRQYANMFGKPAIKREFESPNANESEVYEIYG